MVSDAGGQNAVWAFVENEHRELVRGINRIHDVACDLGRAAKPDQASHILELLRWFNGSLEPHMAWEEITLFPELDRRAGTSWATRAARFDHQQMRELAAKLRAGNQADGPHPAADGQDDMRCRLFSLEALLRAHVEREERFLIPLLTDDRLTPPGMTAGFPDQPGLHTGQA